MGKWSDHGQASGGYYKVVCVLVCGGVCVCVSISDFINN